MGARYICVTYIIMHGKSYTCIIYLYSVPRFCFHFFLLNISILINPHSMNSAPLFHNIELFIWKTSLFKQTLNTPTISTSRYGISKSNNSRFFLPIFVPKIDLFIYFLLSGGLGLRPCTVWQFRK